MYDSYTWLIKVYSYSYIQYAIFIEIQLKLMKYKNKNFIMVFSNCESKMGDFEPDVDIDEKQAGFKLDKDRF